MAIEREAFVEAGRWMTIPVDRLRAELRTFDADGSGAISGVGEFAALYDGLAADGFGSAGPISVAGAMRQAPVADPAPLDDRALKDVPELQPVWGGLGRIERARGTTAGTRAVQQALNLISERLPDYPKAAVGAADGMFGGITEAGVKAFQAAHRDLDSSGKVDQATLKQLDDVLARARKIAVNDIGRVQPGVLRAITYNDRFGSECVLTFDDGPDVDTIMVLDALAEGAITGATFFVQGLNARRNPAILQRIVDENHVIGNHTYDHPDLRRLSVAKVERQLRMCQDAVEDALGREYPMKQMRPPYGAVNARVRSVLRALDLAMLLWQVDTNDWRRENRRNPQNILASIFGGAAPVTGGRGGLILFHDIHPSTGAILPDVIRRLREANLTHTTADALLARKYPG